MPIAEVVNATVIPLEQAAEGYKAFDGGAAKGAAQIPGLPPVDTLSCLFQADRP